MSSAEAAIDPADAGCQLLLIGPPTYDPARLAGHLDAVLAVGGIAGFVLPVDLARQQGGSIARQLAPLRAVCADHATAFLVRDHVGLALEIGADGVHLGDAAGAQAARAALRGGLFILPQNLQPCGRPSRPNLTRRADLQQRALQGDSPLPSAVTNCIFQGDRQDQRQAHRPRRATACTATA